MEKSMISLCLLGGLAIGNGFAQTPSKPNILLIIADDCSYYDIGCFGAVNNKTPHIDALARQGIKFNSAYNSVSMSTPTRHCVFIQVCIRCIMAVMPTIARSMPM